MAKAAALGQREAIPMEMLTTICAAAHVSEAAQRRLLRLFRRNASRNR
jgi:hypothetical protein